MKTYKQTINKPQLVIEYDADSGSPREWDNLGYFITCELGYNSPDDNEEIKNIIQSTGEEAENQKDHIKLIKSKFIEHFEEKVIAIYPIVKYEHSGISYSLGNKHGFDYSNNGFYIVTDETQKLIGTKKKDFEKVIKQELDTYNKWINGELYQFTLYNEYGDFEDGCGGYYNIEDIKECLPAEWQDEDLQDCFIYS